MWPTEAESIFMADAIPSHLPSKSRAKICNEVLLQHPKPTFLGYIPPNFLSVPQFKIWVPSIISAWSEVGHSRGHITLAYLPMYSPANLINSPYHVEVKLKKITYTLYAALCDSIHHMTACLYRAGHKNVIGPTDKTANISCSVLSWARNNIKHTTRMAKYICFYTIITLCNVSDYYYIWSQSNLKAFNHSPSLRYKYSFVIPWTRNQMTTYTKIIIKILTT
jgi:hypothetical protein